MNGSSIIWRIDGDLVKSLYLFIRIFNGFKDVLVEKNGQIGIFAKCVLSYVLHLSNIHIYILYTCMKYGITALSTVMQ